MWSSACCPSERLWHLSREWQVFTVDDIGRRRVLGATARLSHLNAAKRWQLCRLPATQTVNDMTWSSSSPTITVTSNSPAGEMLWKVKECSYERFSCRQILVWGRGVYLEGGGVGRRKGRKKCYKIIFNEDISRLRIADRGLVVETLLKSFLSAVASSKASVDESQPVVSRISRRWQGEDEVRTGWS